LDQWRGAHTWPHFAKQREKKYPPEKKGFAINAPDESPKRCALYASIRPELGTRWVKRTWLGLVAMSPNALSRHANFVD